MNPVEVPLHAVRATLLVLAGMHKGWEQELKCPVNLYCCCCMLFDLQSACHAAMAAAFHFQNATNTDLRSACRVMGLFFLVPRAGGGRREAGGGRRVAGSRAVFEMSVN